jgi:hypothetical protein
MAARIDSSLAGTNDDAKRATAAPVQRHDDPALDEGLVEAANDDGNQPQHASDSCQSSGRNLNFVLCHVE